MTSTGAEVPARHAATVVLVRDGSEGLETLLLRRTGAAGFVPGAHVFPGGTVDPADRVAEPMVSGLSPMDACALTGVVDGGLSFWVAAVRECLEEAGVAPGVVDAAAVASGEAPSPAPDLSSWRGAVHRGQRSMASVLAEAGARIDATAIRCFARWVTPVGLLRRFDTRFFLAVLPRGAEASADGQEIVAHDWMTPAVALDRFAQGEITVIIPTVRTLVALEGFPSATEAMAGLRFGDPAEALLPEMVEDGGRSVVRLPADPEGNGATYDGDTGMPLD